MPTTAMKPSEIDSLARDIKRFRLDPNAFCVEVLNSPNDIWQAEMLDAIADIDRIKEDVPTLFNHEGLQRFSIAAFHGPGKTHWLAKFMHWYNFTRKARIPCTAPKERQLTTRLWPEFRKILAKSDHDFYKSMIKVDTTKISWCGDVDWCALVETASQPENLAGYHDENLAFLVEEASGVNNAMFPVIEGALTEENAIFIMIGNPTKTTGEFSDSHNKVGTKELYYCKQIQHHESTRVSKKWVDGMIKKYGRQSPIVKVRVFGEFVTIEENQLIAMDWLDAAFGAESKNDGSIPRLRLSVDVADGGIDESVVIISDHYDTGVDFVKLFRFNFPSSESPIKLAQAAQRMFNQYIAEGSYASGDIVVDSLGVGAGTAGYLLDFNLPVITYKGGASSDDSTKWRNKRVQSYISFRDNFRDGHISILEGFCSDDDWDDFCVQVLSVKTKPGIERVEDLMTKQEMLKRGIKSPDMADGGAMQFATNVPTLSSLVNEPMIFGTLETAC